MSKILKPKSSQAPQLSKTWFDSLFRDSATLVVARITAASGFITAIIGGLDWSPLLGMSGFDRKQVIVMGGIVLLIGISHEIARRRTLDT